MSKIAKGKLFSFTVLKADNVKFELNFDEGKFFNVYNSKRNMLNNAIYKYAFAVQCCRKCN